MTTLIHGYRSLNLPQVIVDMVLKIELSYPAFVSKDSILFALALKCWIMSVFHSSAPYITSYQCIYTPLMWWYLTYTCVFLQRQNQHSPIRWRKVHGDNLHCLSKTHELCHEERKRTTKSAQELAWILIDWHVRSKNMAAQHRRYT